MDTNNNPFPDHAQPVPVQPPALIKHRKTSPVIKFSKFLMVLSLLGITFTALAYLSFLITGLYYVALFVVIILTLGTVLLNKSFRSSASAGESMYAVGIWMYNISWYVLIPTIILAAVSMLIVILNRAKHRTWKALLIACIFLLVVAIVLLLLRLNIVGDIYSQLIAQKKD